MSFLEIHCPNCGEFHHQSKKRLDRCPDCGSAQAIILLHDYEIDRRFEIERNGDKYGEV